MALFYDRDYGQGNWNRGYDRGYRDRSGWGASDRGSRMGGDRYDRNYKSQWQTDYGDPFNDRGTNTPMRMTRGEYRTGYDRGFGGGSRSDYDRDYSANPMGYDPYADQTRRSSGWNRYDRGYGGRDLGSQGYRNEGFGNRESREYGSQGFGNRSFGSQGYGRQGYRNQGYGNEGFGNRSFGNRGFGSRGYDQGWF